MKLGTKTLIAGILAVYATVNAKECIEIVDVERENIKAVMAKDKEQCRVKIGSTINIVYAETDEACDLIKQGRERIGEAF